MLNNRVNIKSGDRFGKRVLVKEVNKKSRGRGILQRIWTWKCDCGNTGQSYLDNIRRSKSCTRCGGYAVNRERKLKYLKDKLGPLPVYEKGDKLGVWVILDIVQNARTRTENPRNITYYKARCTKCGFEAVRRANNLKTSKGSCINCRNKYVLFGKQFTLNELSEIFGIKKSLILHRLGRKKMTIEEAVLIPVRMQGRKDGLKLCRVCLVEQPTENFTKTMSLCKSCRCKMKKTTMKERKQK